MADKKLWSLKNDGAHILGSTSFRHIFPDDATNIPTDVTIQVVDPENFMKPPVDSSVEKTKEQYEVEKKLFGQILTLARQKSGGTQDSSHTYASMTEQDIKNNIMEQRKRADAEAEMRLSTDPIKEYTKRWNDKVQEDDRHVLSFLTRFPQLVGETREDPKKFLDHFFKNYAWDSFMGISNTAWKILPSNNAQNRSIVGEVVGNLGLYMLGARNKAVKKFLHPGAYKTRAGAFTAQTAGFIGSSLAGSEATFLGYEALTDALRTLKDIPDPENHENRNVQQLFHMKNAFLWNSGASALGPAAHVLRKGLAKAYGVGDKWAHDLFWKAAEQGMPIGIAQASKPGWWTKGYASVIGVFPFIGSPFRTQKGKISWLMDKKIVDTLNELGPVAHMAHLGMLTTRMAQRRFDKYAAMNAQLYDDWSSRAKRLDAKIPDGYIPSEKIKLMAASFKSDLEAGKIPLTTGQTMGGEAIGDFETMILNMADIQPQHLTAQQFRDLQKNYNLKWREYESKFKIQQEDPIAIKAGEFKKAIEDAFNTTQGWKTAGLNKADLALMQTVKNSLTDANSHFSTFADVFQSPVAKHVTLVDENIFTAGALEKLGWKYEDQIATDLFDSFLSGEARSPKALENLNELVGPQIFKKYARQYMENLYRNSGEVIQFNWAQKAGLWGGEGKAITKEEWARSEGWGRDDIFREKGGYTKEFTELEMPYPVAGAGAAERSLLSKEDYVKNELGFQDSQIRNYDGSYTDDSNRVKMPSYTKGTVKQTGENSFEITAINPERWEKLLGIGSGDKSGEIFLRRLYKELGYSGVETKGAIQSLRDIIELSKVNIAVKIGDTAQFVKRRVVLAGAAGATGAFLATSMGDPMTGVAMALLARYGSNILTKPAALKAMVTVANPEFNDKMRRGNYLRLLRLAFDKENPIPEGMTMDDFRDPVKALDYLMGATFTVNDEGNQVDVSQAVTPQPVGVQPGAGAGGPGGQYSEAAGKVPPNVPEKKVSNNVSAEVKSRMASNFVRQKGVPGSTTLNQNQRAALAGGNLYSAIAAAKHGGAVYNDGIMNLANRRRV